VSVSAAWHDVAALADLERDGRAIVRVGAREIGIVADRASGRLHALRHRCPHMGGPLCLGRVGRRVAGGPGQYVLEPRATLRGPGHGWEFDLETGRGVDDAALRAAVYPVRVEDGRVLVRA
jgi:3-phenylpropionate/trans-cinnamate dioxygenase ferredoxin subunit